MLLDQAVPFDTIDHNILLKRMEKPGGNKCISPNIKSYLREYK